MSVEWEVSLDLDSEAVRYNLVAVGVTIVVV